MSVEPVHGVLVQGAPMLPDGPVILGIAVLTEDGEVMGAARCRHPPAWLWRASRLCIGYGETVITIARGGTYAAGLIVAMPAAWTGPGPVPLAPMWRISLGRPAELRAGNSMHVLDGVVAIIPD